MRGLLVLLVLALLAITISANVHVNVEVSSAPQHHHQHHQHHEREHHEHHNEEHEEIEEMPHILERPLTHDEHEDVLPCTHHMHHEKYDHTANIISESELDEASASGPDPKLLDVHANLAKWMKKYGKKWTAAQQVTRTRAFTANLQAAVEFNHNPYRPYDLALNQNSDLTPEEFTATSTGALQSEISTQFAAQHKSASEAEVDEAELDDAVDESNLAPRRIDFDPITYTGGLTIESHAGTRNDHKNKDVRTVDWHAKGKVVPVRNQGQCGSCWAFSGSDAFASAVSIQTNTPPQLFSPQYLVDCDITVDPEMQKLAPNARPNKGCNGGNSVILYSWLRFNNHVLEKNYPYKGRNGRCNKKAKKSPYHVNLNLDQALDVATNIEQMKAVVTRGPAQIVVNGSSRSFQLYKGGIFSDPSCSKETNHLVLLTGYGSEAGVPYWIIKNSWTEYWGEGGYMRIRMGANTCGIEELVVRPVIAQ